MSASRDGWLLHASVGSLGGLGRRCPNRSGRGVRGVQCRLTQYPKLAGGPEMHRRGGVQPDPTVPVLMVVVVEKQVPERPGIGQRPEPVRKDGRVLQRLERRFAIRVVVRDVRT